MSERKSMREQVREFKKNPILIVGLLILISLFGYAVYDAIVLDPQLKNTGRYTIGVATDTYKPPKGGTVIEFVVIVNGEEYTAVHPFRKSVKKNSRYLIRFLPDNPEKSEVLLKCPVPDEIIDVPSDGWEKPPYRCDD